jgi:nitroreductase
MKPSFIELVKSRRSVRRFQEKPVERELLLECIEAARFAPSASHVQPWRFLIVDDSELKEALVQRAFSGIFSASRWAAKAPTLVVILAELDITANRIGKQFTGLHYYLIDIGIAGEHFVLQAQELGLGACWIGWFSARGVRKALNIPRKYRPASILAIGYPDVEHFSDKSRHPVEKICWFNKVS